MILQCTGQPPKQRIIWPELSIIQSLRKSGLKQYTWSRKSEIFLIMVCWKSFISNLRMHPFYHELLSLLSFYLVATSTGSSKTGYDCWTLFSFSLRKRNGLGWTSSPLLALLWWSNLVVLGESHRWKICHRLG